jgi:hypothetical protein
MTLSMVPGEEGSLLVSFPPFMLSPSVSPAPAPHRPFIPFTAIPFHQFVLSLPFILCAFCRYPFRSVHTMPVLSLFAPFCRYPLTSVRAVPVVSLFHPFCRYPFESAGSNIRCLVDCIHSSTITHPKTAESCSRSQSGGLARASRQQKLLNANSQP